MDKPAAEHTRQGQDIIEKFTAWQAIPRLISCKKPISHEPRNDECDIGFSSVI